MYIVIFCNSGRTCQFVGTERMLGICDHVACRTTHHRTVFDIEEKNIRIDIRHADILKAAGLRPDYVLIYEASYDFIQAWEHNMKGRYTELKSLEELIQLVIKED